MTEGTQFCISCGEIFHPVAPEALLCPSCGGLPEALLEAPVALTEIPAAVSQPSMEPGISSDWQVGDLILDTYEVKAVLGQGGFGKVYRVHHRAWNVDLAVKRSLNLEEATRQSFVDEAEKWIDLGLHPHIVTCYYVRNIDGFPHTFAELAEGGSLKDWIEGEERKLYAGGSAAALERILDIAIQFAWGLAYAHEQGLVHQDVKPGNVLMTVDGIAKVTDFGLARARQPTIGGDLMVSTAGGTPAFCSPEQVRRERLSVQTDIWSWGVSVLEMFAGEMFWQYGEAADEVLEGFLEEGAYLPDVPKMPAQVAELLQQCFQRDPAERSKDMLEVVRCLQEIYQQEISQPYIRQLPKAAELRADSLNNKALSLLDLGRQKDAENAWKQALQADPKHIESVFNFGLVQWRGAQITDDSLIEQLENILGGHPDDWRLFYLLSQVHLERDDCENALAYLLKIRPDDSNEEVIDLQKRILERQKQSTHLNFWLEGHSGPIYCLAASSDFKYLASGGEDKILKFWDLSTRKHLRDLAGHTWPITAIRLSGDGSHALSGSYDGTARFWNTFTGTPIKSLGFGGIGDNLDLDRDGTYAVFGKDQMLQFGNLFSDTLSSTNDLGIRPIPVRILTIGRLVISGAENYSICEWQLPSGQLVRKFKGHTSLISALCISRNKLFFLSGSMDKSIKLWDVSSGECILTMQAHEQIDTINVSADMKHALSGGNLSTRLWDLETGRCLRTFSCEKGGRSCLSEDGQQAVIANGNRLACWNISPPYEYVPAAFTLSRVSRFELILDRQDVYQKAFADAREAIKAGNIIEGMKQLYIARQQPGFSRHETAFREWQGLYTSLPCKGLRDVWNVRTFEHSTKGASHQISCAAISQDGTVGISGGGREDQNVYVWDLTNGKRIFTLNHGSSIDAIWLNQDAAFALTTGGDQVAQKNSRSKHSIKLWNLRTGEFSGRIPHPMLEGHQQPINCLDVSADGRLILSGSWDGSIRLWDLMNYGKCLRIFSGHKGWVTSIRFSGDGKQALSVAGSQFKRWDIASGRCLQTIDRAAEIDYDEFFLVRTDLVLARGSLKGGQRKSIVELRDLATDQQIRIFEGYRPSSLTASMNGKLAIIGSYNGNLYFVDLPSGEKIISVAGHTSAVNSVDISENGSYAISAGEDGKLKLWALDWDLEAKEYADWDDRATPYLQDFITYHTPYSANLPSKYQFTDDEVFRALTHRGKPAWTEADFQGLLYTLGCAGYGWLRPEGVRKKLEELMREIQG